MKIREKVLIAKHAGKKKGQESTLLSKQRKNRLENREAPSLIEQRAFPSKKKTNTLSTDSKAA